VEKQVRGHLATADAPLASTNPIRIALRCSKEERHPALISSFSDRGPGARKRILGFSCGRAPGVDRPEKALVGVLNVSVNDNDPSDASWRGSNSVDPFLESSRHAGKITRTAASRSVPRPSSR
jgi:hypothetical protein